MTEYDFDEDPLFFWKLSDELSVFDAAILIIGENPSEQVNLYDQENGYCLYDKDGVMRAKQRRDYRDLEPVMKALRSAIFNNKLRANLSYPARGAQNYSPDTWVMGERVFHTVNVDLGGETEECVTFDHLVSVKKDGGTLRLGGPLQVLKGADELWIMKEPDWEQTTIDADDLRVWLEERNIRPHFFFPHSKSGGFEDKNGPRYSPKLACAVAAWNAVEKPQRSKSVKESLKLWVQSNGVAFGLGDESGVVPQKAIDEISTVSNWNTKGGATRTSVEVDENDVEAVENFKDQYKSDRDLDSEIPF